MKKTLTGDEPMAALTLKQFLSVNIFASLLVRYGNDAINIGLSAIVHESHDISIELIREFNKRDV
jgi:hypothetical protein